MHAAIYYMAETINTNTAYARRLESELRAECVAERGLRIDVVRRMGGMAGVLHDAHKARDDATQKLANKSDEVVQLSGKLVPNPRISPVADLGALSADNPKSN